MQLFYDETILDAFKSKISYTKILSRLKEETVVYVNWPEHLQELTIDDVVWSNMDYTSVAIDGDHHSSMSTSFEKGERQVSLQFFVFNNKKTAEILDFMLEMMSVTSMREVAYEYLESGPGSVYFKTPQYTGKGDSALYCLYSNMILKIKTVENDVDVRPFARKIIEIIDTNKTKPAYKAPPFDMSFSLSPDKIAAGERFLIKLQPGVGADIQSEVNLDGLTDTFEVKARTHLDIELEALRTGKFMLPVRFMDTATLYSGVISINVNVDVKK